MKIYYGTKRVLAEPMTLGAYHEYRGQELLKGQNKDQDGYLVEYTDGGGPNHPNHVGYISWSPGGVFENAYQEDGNLSFSHALVAIKEGKRVARAGWNGKNMWLALQVPDEHSKMRRPYIYMKPIDKNLVPWVASQSDLLMDDWFIVD